jgi:ribokinase
MSKILIFGSINIDQVFTVPNIVRPGETLSSLKQEIFAGGKGIKTNKLY